MLQVENAVLERQGIGVKHCLAFNILVHVYMHTQHAVVESNAWLSE
jgi:hypothetical protein